MPYIFNHFALLFDNFDGNIGSADLLRNSSGFAVLHVRSAKFIQNFRFTGVDVT